MSFRWCYGRQPGATRIGFTVALLAGLVACNSDKEPIKPEPGVLNGLWDGVAFDFSDDLGGPLTRITIAIVHEGSSISAELIHPGFELSTVAWDGDTLSMVWSDPLVSTEFRAGLSSADRLEGRWIVSSDGTQNSSSWYADRQ